MGISTHILDTAAGRPAAGVAVRLERQEVSGWRVVGDHERHARRGDRFRDVVLVEFHVVAQPTATG